MEWTPGTIVAAGTAFTAIAGAIGVLLGRLSERRSKSRKEEQELDHSDKAFMASYFKPMLEKLETKLAENGKLINQLMLDHMACEIKAAKQEQLIIDLTARVAELEGRS